MPGAGAQAAAGPQQDEARGGRQQGEAEDIAELVAGEHARVGKNLVGLLQAEKDARQQGLQLRVEEAEDEQTQQGGQANGGQGKTATSAPGLRGAGCEAICAQAGEDRQGQAEGEDPAEGRVQLVDAGQQPEQAVSGQAEHEAQAGQGKQEEEERRGACAGCGRAAQVAEGEDRADESQDAAVEGGLYVVFDAPLRRWQCLARASEEVSYAVVGGIAVEVRQEELDKVTRGVGPGEDLFVGSRAAAEVCADEFVERDELQRGERQTDGGHCEQPGQRAQGLVAAQLQEADESPCGGDEQGVVAELGMAGEQDAAEGERTECGPERASRAAGQGAGADDALDQQQQEGLPSRCGEDHGEDGADNEEGGELPGEGGDEAAEASATQAAQQGIHAGAGQPQLRHGEPTVGQPEGQDVEEEAEGVEGRVLAGGEEGDAAELMRIPQGRLTGSQAVTQEALPGVIL